MGEKTNTPDPAAGGAQVAEEPATTDASPPSPYEAEPGRKGLSPDGQHYYDGLRDGGLSPDKAVEATREFLGQQAGGTPPGSYEAEPQRNSWSQAGQRVYDGLRSSGQTPAQADATMGEKYPQFRVK